MVSSNRIRRLALLQFLKAATMGCFSACSTSHILQSSLPIAVLFGAGIPCSEQYLFICMEEVGGAFSAQGISSSAFFFSLLNFHNPLSNNSWSMATPLNPLSIVCLAMSLSCVGQWAWYVSHSLRHSLESCSA